MANICDIRYVGAQGLHGVVTNCLPVACWLQWREMTGHMLISKGDFVMYFQNSNCGRSASRLFGAFFPHVCIEVLDGLSIVSAKYYLHKC